MFSYHTPDDEDFDVRANGRTQPFYQDEKGIHIQIGVIGCGNQGGVYKFQSEKDPSYFTAIKMFDAHTSAVEIEAEQEMMALVHGFCHISDYRGNYFTRTVLMLMPFLSGVPLNKYLDSVTKFEDICQLYCSVAKSLDELHKKYRIAHKDFSVP